MLLDFEKPIVELEKKLAAMQDKFNEHALPQVKDSICRLEREITTLRQKTFTNLTRWQRVQLARHPNRPYTFDYITAMTDEFVELHGDRLLGDDLAVVGGFGSIGGMTVMFIGHQKGRNTQERKKRNFGMANPSGYRKALRLMKLAEKFGKPIVTLIDTPGAYPGIQAEEYGQAEAIARNIQSMFDLSVPIICIVIGEGASGGALGLAIGDQVLMLEHTWYSVISPESCASILWKSWDYKEQAAEVLKLTSQDMLKFGLIDDIITEPAGGAHRNPAQAASLIRENIITRLHKLKQMELSTLLARRTEKFCAMGVFD